MAYSRIDIKLIPGFRIVLLLFVWMLASCRPVSESGNVITSLPFDCNQSNTTYTFASNLEISEGNGITVNADNVIIDGAGHRLAYSGDGGGVAILINGEVFSIEIKNIVFQQGNHNPKSGERPHSIFRNGSASGVKIHNNTFNIRYGGAHPRSSVYAINMINGRRVSTDNEIYSNTFNMAGDSGARAINIDTNSGWEGTIHSNTISMRKLHHGPSGYARAIMMSGDGNNKASIHSNHITLDDSVDTIQGISTWRASNFDIYNNTIISAANHARAILIDGDSDGNKIYRNTIQMTSQHTKNQASAGIRVRYGSDNNKIYSNTIDASTGNNSFPLRLGGDDRMGQPSGTLVHDNILSSKSRTISIEEGSDIILNNNTINTNKDGVAVYFWCTSKQPCNEISFNNNRISGNIKLVGEKDTLVSKKLMFCNSTTNNNVQPVSGIFQYEIRNGIACEKVDN